MKLFIFSIFITLVFCTIVAFCKDADRCRVCKVNDGDTFKYYLNGDPTKSITVRMIGVDTPEKEDKSKRAQKFTDKYNLPLDIAHAWGLMAW